uniref:Uncharacterized protein n=1 Tax=Glossina austeni TaxID=7395 RepID=A0A1A9VR74_GLOAU
MQTKPLQNYHVLQTSSNKNYTNNRLHKLLQTNFEKIEFEIVKGFENKQIVEIGIEERAVLTRLNDNPSNLDTIMEKRTSKLQKANIYKVALDKDDIIFACKRK